MSVRYFLLHAQQREHGTSDSNISGLQNMETMYDVFCDGNSEKAYSVAKYVAGPPPPFQFILTADEPWLRRHSSDLFCDAIRVTGKKVVCVCHSSKQASKQASGLLLAVERRPIFFPVDLRGSAISHSILRSAGEHTTESRVSTLYQRVCILQRYPSYGILITP